MDEKHKSLVFKLINKKLVRLESYISSLKALSNNKEINPIRTESRTNYNDRKNLSKEFNNLQSEVCKLHMVLERLQNEGFGFCSICRSAIPIQKLVLNPELNSCNKCESGQN